MRERFSSTELTALRNDLLQGGMIDSRNAAELLQVFLMGRGYGVSPQAARFTDLPRPATPMQAKFSLRHCAAAAVVFRRLGTAELSTEVLVRPDEPTRVLAELTSEAVARGEELEGLQVRRPSLEEVYLALTAEEEAEVEA